MTGIGRLRWSLGHGRELELGPLPERKSAYLVLADGHGLHTLARAQGDIEAGQLAGILDELVGTEGSKPQ